MWLMRPRVRTDGRPYVTYFNIIFFVATNFNFSICLELRFRISVFFYPGLYVSRNTYIRTGIAEWKITNPVHLVCS